MKGTKSGTITDLNGFCQIDVSDLAAANIKSDGKLITNKQGTYRDTDGSKTLAVWIELRGNEKIDFIIR